jgi:hypothetical protein
MRSGWRGLVGVGVELMGAEEDAGTGRGGWKDCGGCEIVLAGVQYNISKSIEYNCSSRNRVPKNKHSKGEDRHSQLPAPSHSISSP